MVGIVIFNSLILLLPTTNSMDAFFGIVPFVDDSGKQYRSYQLWVGLGVLINSAVTILAEKLVAQVLTKFWDQKQARAKKAALDAQMETYRTEAEGLELLEPDCVIDPET